MYSYKKRVSFSEIGKDGIVPYYGILYNLQDCSTFQSEEVGLGLKVLKEWKRFWVLSAGQVIVERYPALGEQIRTSTWAYGFRGFMGFRNFTMDTADGERLAYANTFWTYINRENGVPVRLTERDMEGYGLEEKLEMDYAPRKIVLPEKYIKEDTLRLKDIMIKFDNFGYNYTADEVIEYYSTFPKNGYFICFSENLIEQLKQIGKIRTAETYTTTLNSFRRFMHSRKKIVTSLSIR